MEPSDLIRRREALKLTAPQLARELDVAESSVYRWESGKVPLHGPTAVGVDTILKDLERRAARQAGGQE